MHPSKEHKEKEYPISEDLLNLTHEQIESLDQEATGGEGFDYYCAGNILKASVFLNRVAGIVRDFEFDYIARAEVRGDKILTACSCSRNGLICKHVIALLYSWVNDSADFTDVGECLRQLQYRDKESLLEVIGRFMLKDPTNADLLDEPDSTQDDYDLEGWFN